MAGGAGAIAALRLFSGTGGTGARGAARGVAAGLRMTPVLRRRATTGAARCAFSSCECLTALAAVGFALLYCEGPSHMADTAGLDGSGLEVEV